MKDKKVLVVGSGGRCHAMVDAFARSRRVEKIYCAPGNAGMARQAECVAVPVTDVEALADFAAREGIDLTVVGPEASLCAGIADVFEARGLKIFGPVKSAARIESSKEFAKEIMERAGVPTASYEAFAGFDEALAYVKGRPLPAVIKYDGLAAGKGVVVAATYEEAESALRDMLLDEAFGKGRVIVEDFLEGPEFSFMCFVNGDKVYPLAMAQDHKRAFDGDEGPNTGGMGAYSPVPFVTPEIERTALDRIMIPVAREMVKNGTPFLGILYGGLILTTEGPKVIEFNARFGDPETEVVLPRLKSDLYDFIEAVMEGRDFVPEWKDMHYVGVVLAANGYPGSYRKGLGLNLTAAEGQDGIMLYHMGTAMRDDRLVSDGGRVLMVVAAGRNLVNARNAALNAVEDMATADFFYRTDICKGLVMDGKAYASQTKKEVAELVESNLSRIGRRPGIALVLAGDDRASARYVAGKIRDAEECGIVPLEVRLAGDVTEGELIEAIRKLNADSSIDGIMVQLPLPSGINERRILREIAPDKDVDGFGPENVALLWTTGGGIEPCTPRGVFEMLLSYGIRPEGKRAVVVGRSRIVGQPMAKLLQNAGATVTTAHSKTKDLGAVTREADILVVAAGKPGLITADMVKPGAVVVDVGISHDPATGKLTGDVDFESVRKKASAITPVPGGVGPLTKAFLMKNTAEAWLAHN